MALLDTSTAMLYKDKGNVQYPILRSMYFFLLFLNLTVEADP